ncbi:2-hydroxy-6-oxo-2,4-heptadienoate hydrolase (plasmid) [Sphingobium sp. AntQ-1]|uniref:alpha/beta fold hydrolase n=1 Tax=Sphingobium sp. AntQ-1 TaxID=2930091 RepID=UPI00234F0D65|nr:alpha/beta fold hydrolase [Sphingobium sp. AntQ-1]WCP15971.1 2-hydroxy-6-oxo-2,4-heptadienoate hydrolase [Sphingobium sp. AntQ-1]
MDDSKNPELGKTMQAAGIATNYIEAGEGPPVVLIHGSGPGVTAYANWRLTLPGLSTHLRVLAPDMAGFGYTERKPGVRYDLDFWIGHLLGCLDAWGLERTHLVGNSFGGGLALAFAHRYPERVDKLVLMGSVGVSFELTYGLDAVWGYQPSMEEMRKLIGIFAHNKQLISDELVASRYKASVRPGYQESFSSLFPEPRQAHIEALATPEQDIAALPHEVLIVHGRDDQVIPVSNAIRLNGLLQRSDLHIFGQCGHWTQIERATQFNRLVKDFLIGGSKSD